MIESDTHTEYLMRLLGMKFGVLDRKVKIVAMRSLGVPNDVMLVLSFEVKDQEKQHFDGVIKKVEEANAKREAQEIRDNELLEAVLSREERDDFANLTPSASVIIAKPQARGTNYKGQG